MKRVLSIVGATCLTIAMCLPASASQKISNDKIGQLYNSYINKNINKNINKKLTNMPVNTMKITKISEDISSFSNDQYRFNMILNNDWQMVAQEDSTKEMGVNSLMYFFANATTKSSIGTLFADFTGTRNFNVDIFYNEVYNYAKSELGDDITGFNSVAINGITYKFYSYTQDGINAISYMANDGSKVYMIDFINTTESEINAVLNYISIGDKKAPAPVVPEAPVPAPVIPEAPVPAPVIPDAPVPAPVTEAPKKINNDLLYLYNNNVYKNDDFKFNITLDDNWQKPAYETAEFFATGDEYSSIDFISLDESNPLNLIVKLNKVDSTKTLDQLIKELIVGLSEESCSNFSVSKKTTIHGTTFNYFTFDLLANHKIRKSYMYVGVKDDLLYVFGVSNVNDANKALASKALKSIVIQ